MGYLLAFCSTLVRLNRWKHTKQIRTRILHCRANPAMMLRAIHGIPNCYSQRHLNYSHGFLLPAFRNHATLKPQKAPKTSSINASLPYRHTNFLLPPGQPHQRKTEWLHLPRFSVLWPRYAEPEAANGPSSALTSSQLEKSFFSFYFFVGGELLAPHRWDATLPLPWHGI